MSNIDTLTKELNDVKSELTKAIVELNTVRQQLSGVIAQCKASEEIISEMQKRTVIDRTNLNLTREHSQKLQKEIQSLMQQNEELKAAKHSPCQPPLKDAKDSKAA